MIIKSVTTNEFKSIAPYIAASQYHVHVNSLLYSYEP